MKGGYRLLALLLCLFTVFGVCACRHDPGGEETTPQSGTGDPQTNDAEEIRMPMYLCDKIDAVHIDRVMTTPTFAVPENLPEDAAQAVIVPHFTVGSSMVLQRRAVNLIRGTTAGEHIAVAFGDEQYYGTVANGKFEVYLPPMEAAEGKDLVILTDTAKRTLSNVCVGEVFLLNGQSNMVWSLGWSGDIHKDVIESATEKNIRVLRMNHTESEYERADAEGNVEWQTISPEIAKNFSAVGYLFGKRLHSELNIPIGLVQAAVSGSTLAFWLPADAYREYIAAGNEAYSSTASGNLMPCLGYNGMVAPLVGMRFRGVVWYQGEANTSDNLFYAKQLTKLIQTYREKFSAPNLAFTVMELPKATPTATIDYPEKWAPIKAAQRQVASETENVAFSVSIDLGHTDVHPTNKTVYARRAAEITLNKFFGIAIDPFPTVAATQRISETIVSLTLEGGSGFSLQNGKNGFEVSTDGNTFIPATDVQLTGNELFVIAETPIRYVRYGVIFYAGEPDFAKHITVYNAEGNPMDQFLLYIE